MHFDYKKDFWKSNKKKSLVRGIIDNGLYMILRTGQLRFYIKD